MPDQDEASGHIVRVGGVAGQALPADVRHSPDAPATSGEVPVGVTTTESVRGDDGDVDLESMTKDQLYALAQAREIQGRSDMTRDELIDALGG